MWYFGCQLTIIPKSVFTVSRSNVILTKIYKRDLMNAFRKDSNVMNMYFLYPC